MKQQLTLVYISLTDNTRSFVTRLSEYLKENDVDTTLINVKDLVKENVQFSHLNEQTVVFLPTYLEGGNGVDSGYTEILTTPLKDYLSSHDNYKKCLGIVGSGNRNFNNQFCLTARQYSEAFGFPVIDEFELRGTQRDIERIGNKIINLANKGED